MRRSGAKFQGGGKAKERLKKQDSRLEFTDMQSSYSTLSWYGPLRTHARNFTTAQFIGWEGLRQRPLVCSAPPGHGTHGKQGERGKRGKDSKHGKRGEHGKHGERTAGAASTTSTASVTGLL